MSENYLLQKQNEIREISPLLDFLGIDDSKLIDNGNNPVDVIINYNNKRIGIEITDARPYIYDFNNAKNATEGIVKDAVLETISNSVVPYFQIDILLNTNAYANRKLKGDKRLKYEIKMFLDNGYCENSVYIKELHKREYIDIRHPKDKLAFNFQFEGFLNKVPYDVIIQAIEKKEKKLIKYKEIYKESIDEYWLCIGLPFDERGYTIRGANINSNINTGFSRIYITQSLPPLCIELYHQ